MMLEPECESATREDATVRPMVGKSAVVRGLFFGVRAGLPNDSKDPNDYERSIKRSAFCVCSLFSA